MTRRELLRIGLILPVLGVAWRRAGGVRAQGLGQFTTPANAPCKDDKPTPSAPDAATFRAGSPERAVLVEAGMTGQKLVLTGGLRGLVCGPIKGATIDVWHADASGLYDLKGMRFRGHQLTDANGRYRLETIVPGPYAKRARHLNVTVSAPGKPALSTQVFFPDDPMNTKDAAFRPELAMTVTARTAETITAAFDFVLNA